LYIDLMFFKSLDEGKARLLSLGEDRMLVEYDIENSSLDDLKVLSSDRVEQDGVPISLSVYPPVVKESFFLVSNDQVRNRNRIGLNTRHLCQINEFYCQ